MQKLRNATLVFLVKRAQGKIVKICLAMKKRGFGANRWNGAGGKVRDDQRNQIVHVYFAENWSGKTVETEEMKPKWFSVSNLPFFDMWPDDKFWLPKVLKGSLVKAVFAFGDNDAILKKEVKVVDVLEN